MQNELDNFIHVLKRAKNCDLALNILKEIQQNGVFSYRGDGKYWISDVNLLKWIDHMKSKIDEAIELIEKDQ